MAEKKYFRVASNLNKSLHKKLEYFCGKNNYSVSKTINMSLKMLLEEESKWDVLWKRLDKLTASSNKFSLKIYTLGEAFLYFMQYFFALTPDMDDEEKDQANQKGHVRYEKYMRALISRFQKAKAGKGDMLSEKLWSDEEQV